MGDVALHFQLIHMVPLWHLMSLPRHSECSDNCTPRTMIITVLWRAVWVALGRRIQRKSVVVELLCSSCSSILTTCVFKKCAGYIPKKKTSNTLSPKNRFALERSTLFKWCVVACQSACWPKSNTATGQELKKKHLAGNFPTRVICCSHTTGVAGQVEAPIYWMRIREMRHIKPLVPLFKQREAWLRFAKLTLETTDIHQLAISFPIKRSRVSVCLSSSVSLYF